MLNSLEQLLAGNLVRRFLCITYRISNLPIVTNCISFIRLLFNKISLLYSNAFVVDSTTTFHEDKEKEVS